MMIHKFSAHIALFAVSALSLVGLGGMVGCKHTSPNEKQLLPIAAGTAIIESSGGHQIGATGTALKDPLVVQVNDDQGSAVAGALVEFKGAGVTFEPAAALTDSSGQATTTVTLGGIASRYEIDAVSQGKSRLITFSTVETALGYQERLGSILADRYCSRCHDSESTAERVSNYDNLEVKPHALSDGNALNKMSDADLTSIIQHGGVALNRSALMPPYGNTLTLAEVRALIAYSRAVSDPPYQTAGTVYAHK
jgi:hypothetical protein